MPQLPADRRVASRPGRSLLLPLLILAAAACLAGAPANTSHGRAAEAAPAAAAAAAGRVALDPFFDDLEQRTFLYFWELANRDNGLVPDHAPSPAPASIAAVGFGLTAYPIGVERGYISRAAARERVLATLRFFGSAHNQHGFFYHFLDMRRGGRAWESEISTIDTALMVAGMLFCQEYFDGPDPAEAEIRKRADEIYRRLDWTWTQHHPPTVTLGWTPEEGFNTYDWVGYDEAMIIYILALGSPTHPLPPEAWTAWTRAYDQHWGTLYGQTHLSFAPLFGHQFSHVWVDFRGIRDAFMRAHDLDYFENSRRATYAQRSYAIANPMHWQAYGENLWGLTACEGPGKARLAYQGEVRQFRGYAARGVGVGRIIDDGTIAPAAALGSLPFAPEIVGPAALEMYHRFGDALYSTYGFRDAFNMSVPRAPHPGTAAEAGWFDTEYLGIDEGPIIAMIENYRSDLIWRLMRKSPYIRRGLERAGFSGGWLAGSP
jgi:hypothetical protein